MASVPAATPPARFWGVTQGQCGLIQPMTHAKRRWYSARYISLCEFVWVRRSVFFSAQSLFTSTVVCLWLRTQSTSTIYRCARFRDAFASIRSLAQLSNSTVKLRCQQSPQEECS